MKSHMTHINCFICNPSSASRGKDLKEQRGTVSVKVLGGGDGAAYIPQYFRNIV